MSSCTYRCGAGAQGSGYCKPTNTELSREAEAKLKAVMAAREAQDAKWKAAFTQAYDPVTGAAPAPVDPKPPSPRNVAGPGSSSTTTTSAHGNKSAAASWQ